MGGKRGTPAERFARLQGDPDENGCRPWRGHVRPTGYGQFYFNPEHGSIRAHRAAWLLAGNPLLEGHGFHVDHQCHNADKDCPGGDTCPHRRCTEVTHLRVATPRENHEAGRIGYRAPYRETCEFGHPIEIVGSRKQRRCRTCAKKYRREWRARRRAAGLKAN